MKEKRIYIAGHRGMVGSSCWRTLDNSGYKNLIGIPSSELDLRNQSDVKAFIKETKPHIIINAAAKVGGIIANDTKPYEFLMDNLLIQNNLIRSSHEENIEKFIQLGSSCIYPKHAKQPLKEEYLLTGPLEPTNQWYAIAKIAGIKLIESLRNQYNRDYVSLMPSNLYGPNDNYDLNTSHVIPAMIRKIDNAKTNNSNITLWGSGNPMREFLHVDDLSKAVKFCIENSVKESLYNVGSGEEISIKNLANLIKEIVGYDGLIHWDSSKPDGTPRKIMNSEKLVNLGWNSEIDLRSGLINSYKWYKENKNIIRQVEINSL